KAVRDRADLNSLELRVHGGERQRQRQSRQGQLAKVTSRQLHCIMGAAHSKISFVTLLTDSHTPSRIGSDPTVSRGAVRLELTVGIIQCVWGPTPTRSRSAAARIARAAGAFPCPFYLLPFASRRPASIASPGNASAARKVSRNDCASIE